MAGHDAQFWLEMEQYHDLAERFEQNIEVIYPEYVSSRRMCPCLDYANRCGYPLNGTVEYYEYRGERLG